MMENENKENVVGVPENFLNASIISEEPLVTKKRKKGGCNLRNSLAWNPAFLSDEGVLDSDELSSLGGSFHHHDRVLLSSNDRGGEKPVARLPRISEHVLRTKEHGNDTLSFLSKDHNLDQRIDFQPRLPVQEINLGYKESAVDQSVKAMNLVPRYGGCPQPSGLNLQGRFTKKTNPGILPAFSDHKASHLDIQNGSLKLYKMPLSDARVEDKSSFMRVKSSADSVKWAHGVPPANVHSSQDSCVYSNKRKPSAVIPQKPSRLRMPSPSLGFFSKGEPKLGNCAIQDGADNVKLSTSECVSSILCFPHSKLTASYPTCSSKLKANRLLKLDGRSTSKHPDVSRQEVIHGCPTKRKVGPKDGMSTKIPVLAGRLKSDTGNKIIADLKLGSMLVMENSTDLLQPFSGHAVKVGRSFESHVIPTGNEDQHQDGCVTGNSDLEQDSLYCLNQAVIEKAEVVDMSEKDATLTCRKSSESEDLKTMAKTCLKTDIGFSQDENSDLTTGFINCNDHESNFDQKASRNVEMQNTSERDHLQIFGEEEEPENSTMLGSDSTSEGRHIANNNDCKGLMPYTEEISVMKKEPEDKPTDTNLELLSCSISSHCGRKFESEFILPPEVVDLELMRDIEPGERVDFISQQELDSMVKIDIEPDKSLNQNVSCVPIVDPFFDGDCHCGLDKEDHTSHTQSTLPSGLNHPESKKMQEKKNVLQSTKPDPRHMKLNAVPFSDEWLAALESVGEEFLTKKTGSVQNSPPEKMVPEPSPWSPVKRNNRGPFDCTKHTDVPSSNSTVD